MAEEKTQIEVSKKTRERLGKLKLVPRDTYNDVIERLLNK